MLAIISIKLGVKLLRNTPNDTVSQVGNNLKENTANLPFSEVKNYKLENPKNITTSTHLNVNLLRNKFTLIEELIKSKLDIFLPSETKTDNSFPD